MRDKRFQTYLIMLYAYFTVGCVVLAANTALEFMIKDFGWSDSQGGLFISFLAVGNLLSSLFTGVVCKAIGRKRLMILYGVLLFVCYMLISTLNLPIVFYPLALLSGLYWGGVNSITNTTISEMYGNSGSKLNICNACYGVGAVLTPLLLSFFIKNGMSWRIVFRLVAFLGLGFSVLALVRPIPEMKAAEPAKGQSKVKPLAFWREFPFYVNAVLFFCYVGVESATSSWLPSYLSQYNSAFTEIPSATIVSLLWLTLIIGRLICAGPGAKIDCKKLLAFLSCGFLLGVIGMICFVNNTVLLLVSVIITGLGMSGMYASCVANSSRYVANSPMGAGILFATNGLGSSIIPYVAGLVSDSSGMRVGMISLCVFLVILVIAAFVNLFSRVKEDNA